jgi:hypothetical protein
MNPRRFKEKFSIKKSSSKKEGKFVNTLNPNEITSKTFQIKYEKNYLNCKTYFK